MKHKVIVITGTRKGIGKALAERYLRSHCMVVGCSRGEASIDHPNYLHFCLDVATEADVVKMIRLVVNRFGAIDVLLNNAGSASMNHFFTTPGSTLAALFSTNVLGSCLFMREVGKAMARSKQGRIVNFTTVAVPLRLAGEAAYAASKAAIEMLTRVSAKELAPYNITVNAVGPTPIETDLIKAVPKNKIDELIAHQAIHRLGTFEDVANVIDFFLSDKSEFVTGQVVYLGGVG